MADIKKALANAILAEVPGDLSSNLRESLVNALILDMEYITITKQYKVPKIDTNIGLIIVGINNVQQYEIRTSKFENIFLNLKLNNFLDIIFNLPTKVLKLFELLQAIYAVIGIVQKFTSRTLDRQHSTVFAATFLLGRRTDWIVSKAALLKEANRRLDANYAQMTMAVLEDILKELARNQLMEIRDKSVIIKERQLLGDVSTLAKAFPKQS